MSFWKESTMSRKTIWFIFKVLQTRNKERITIEWGGGEGWMIRFIYLIKKKGNIRKKTSSLVINLETCGTNSALLTLKKPLGLVALGEYPSKYIYSNLFEDTIIKSAYPPWCTYHEVAFASLGFMQMEMAVGEDRGKWLLFGKGCEDFLSKNEDENNWTTTHNLQKCMWRHHLSFSHLKKEFAYHFGA